MWIILIGIRQYETNCLERRRKVFTKQRMIKMEKEDFWNIFFDKLDENNGLVDIKLYDGRTLYSIAEAEGDPEDVDKVILFPQKPMNLMENIEVVSYDEIEEIG
jgi:hypothetical protein